MDSTADRAVAIVGVGALLPDAPNAPTFWKNILAKRYSITEVPSERWSAASYYDPDPAAPDKTYSKIGGWVRGFTFDWQRFRIPPKVAAAMDESQQWAVTIAAEALADFGFPDRPLNTENTGVILGTAMGGEMHYLTNLRVSFPEYARALEAVPEFQHLPSELRATLLARWHDQIERRLPPITEDTMPGELANIVAGRVANVLNLRGPNFITDAACASTFAAISAAVEMLDEGHADAVLTGGVDRNMGASSFVKFCKIGALSATGTRPFGDGANGFVMGEGAAVFLLKRLADAERDGDKIYAVIRGIGASSDGKGKGITAPNPVGQVLAIGRAWQNAGLDPATATLVEAHGTSTKVGDVVEVESLSKVFGSAERGRIALGSAKSNIGHLKAGAGAAGLLKTVMALHDKVLPPTLNSETPNPNIHLDTTPFYLNHEAREWEQPSGFPRRAGVSAYGFGGTNFHVVMEEYVPGMLKVEERKQFTGATTSSGQATASATPPVAASQPPAAKPPIRGILALGAATPVALKDVLDETYRKAEGGWAPPIAPPDPEALRAPERLVIDFGAQPELLDKLAKARKAAGFDNPAAWKALQAQGIFRGSGAAPGKIAFLFPGQGSQYVNMGRELAGVSPSVKAVFAEADGVMTPILGRALSSYIFVDSADPAAVKQAERDLMQTAITQPAMLTLDAAVARLLGEYGFRPDMVMGHSLGEYAALTSAGIMPLADALEAAAARGSEMTKVSMGDNGWMAAVMAPLDVVQSTLKEIDGYVVAANINSYGQAVIGGASKAVEQAIELFTKKGFQAQRIPVSHAFHTKIVAPASKPLRQVLNRLRVTPPQLPLVANVTGELYPSDVESIKDLLEQQIASPVQWVKGLETLYANGVRTFVEVGPKKALKGFVDDVLASKPDVVSLFTNHPKTGELASFNQALCGLYAAGYGAIDDRHPTTNSSEPARNVVPAATKASGTVSTSAPVPQAAPALRAEEKPMTNGHNPAAADLGQLLAQALTQLGSQPASSGRPIAYDRNDVPTGSVVISGSGLGLPGAEKPVMDADNALRILRGEQFIDLIPERFRNQMLAKHVTRLVKADDGSGSFETITDPNDVIKLAARPGAFDLNGEYGVPAKLVEALDITTQLAIAAGLDALREAGIPLVQTYKKTSKGTFLPERWLLPESLRDETGVIFASAFPGLDRVADEFERYYEHENRRAQLAALEDLRRYTTDPATLNELGRRIGALHDEIERSPYEFDRRFIFRILAMGHSQFAEYIGARGPNTHVNAACASTTQAIALAEDWVRTGRCRRVLVVAADEVTGERLMEWIGAGFLATGAAATDDRVDQAALPFDRRRHGTILGMGACALVVESEDAVRERGMRGVVELLSSETRNSAFHGTRLDVDHIATVMNQLVTAAERRFGIDRRAIASQTVFVSHETFTPARGGSAAAEVAALRHTFGSAANEIVVANTKGFTGHPMGVGIEDVIALKILEHGIVPPVPNLKELDPDLGALTLSRGGRYPVQYAIHLAAGFGSQLALTFTRRIPGALERVDSPARYDRWLADVSGYDRAETEVTQRVLRIKAQGAPARVPVASSWDYGTGPVLRAAAPGAGMPSYQPAPLHLAPPEIRPAMPERPQVVERPVAPPPAPAPVMVPTTNGHAPAPVVSSPPPAASAPQPPKDERPPIVEAAPAAAPAVTAVVSSSPPAADPVVTRVLAIVAEKTGYPSDMLDLDLDLEADLGVDTVKQAETFAAVREAFDIPRIENLKLRDYPTLASVIGFVRTQRPDLAVAVTNHQPPVVEVAPVATVVVSSPASAVDPVTEKVLAIVAEKTGYPSDMLDLDLDLEADLGVDTVKQAETFAAVREAFDIPRIENLKLRDYPTLASVIGFVRTQRPDLAAAATNHQPPVVEVAPVATVVVSSPASAVDPVTEKVLAIVAEKTGYPSDMLDLDLDLEADLGVDTVKQAETFAAVREAFDIPRIENLKLRDYPTLASVIGFVHTQRPDLAVAVTNHQPPIVEVVPVAVPVAPVAVSSPAAVVDPVVTRVLAIVAEKTGYPQDMLDLDLDLEADLGVDTVKQAETFAAVRAAFDIPRIDDLKLRDYPTLASVIGFVRTQRPDLAVAATAYQPSIVEVAPVAVVAPPVVSSPAAAVDVVTEQVLAIVAEKTGYPQDMLDLDLDLEADLGVDTVKQAETFAAVRAAFDIPRIDDLKLRDYPTLASVIQFVRDHRPDLAQPTPAAQPATASELPPTPDNTVPPVGTPPVAVAAPPVVSSPAAAVDVVTEQVLAIVAEKTGYPPEMLELELDLEADLGVDTVKQAETFAAVRAAFDIPRIDDLKLRDYPTLASVIQFVRDHRPDLAQPTPAARPPTMSEASATPPVVSSPAAAVDVVTEKVLAIVAEKTGYPPEMLELELDLEADLGVDTVKQAETFAAVRAAFDIPRIDDLKLRDYPTLASVIQFVRDQKPELALAHAQPAAATDTPATVVEAQPHTAERQPHTAYSLAEADRAPRRVPVPALRPTLDLCKPTNVALGAGSRVIVAADRGGVGKVLVNRLERRGVTVCDLDPQHDAVTLEAQLHACLAEGPVQGVYWLPALDGEAAIEAMSSEQWHELNRVRAKNLHLVMHTLVAAGEPPFLVAGTRLGGLHGYGASGANAPLGGAVTGFTKAYKREQLSTLVKAVDFEPGRKTAEPAEQLLAETLADPGVVEVGYNNGLRYTVTLEEQPLPTENPGLVLDASSVLLVTGAAGGITSAIINDLAQASGSNFYLLDLTPEPRADDPHIALFRSDKEALKRTLIDELKAAGERPTPVMVDKRIMAIERSEAALRAIEAVQAAGGTAHYHSVNLLDDTAVAAVIDDVRTRYGKLDVLLHAGGIEISRGLADKTPDEFGRVFDIKADGFYSLLHAAAGLPIGATVAFSSVAGRFGNSGQTDYSAANDLLCKITSSMRSWRPDTRAIVIDWTAWGGIGMATRGSIPKIMEMAGIDMLPPEVGIPTIRRELTGGDFRGEMVVGQRLGILTEEFDPTGGLDPAKVSTQARLMLGSVVAAKLYGGLEVETPLDPREQPFLYDHQIDGIPVLPGVMGTESFAEIASLLAPGYHVAAISEQFHSPFKFYRHEPRTLRLSARIMPGCDGELVAHTALRSFTAPSRPGLPAREDLHFTATVRLTAAPVSAPAPSELPASFMDGEQGVKEVEQAAIYKVYFHGPAYQVLERAFVSGGQTLGVMSAQLPPNSVPADAATLMAPRLIELCFQTAGIWEMANRGVMALPLGIGSVTVYRQPEQANGARLYALVRAVDDGAAFDARVLDDSGNVYVELHGYRTVQLPGSVTL